MEFDPPVSDYNFDVQIKPNPSNANIKPFVNILWPKGHILGERVGGEQQKFLTGDSMRIHGFYHTHGKVHLDNTDSITVSIEAENVQSELFAYHISYLGGMWVNYFTVQRNWMTSDEFKFNGYKNDKGRNISTLQWTDDKGFPLPQNDCEYFVTIKLRRVRVEIPTNLYTKQEKCVIGFGQEFTMEIRHSTTYLDCSDFSTHTY